MKAQIPFKEEVLRREKICPKCVYFFVDKETIEGECIVDEDPDIAEFCEDFIHREDLLG